MVTPLRSILTTITKRLKLEPAAHLARAREVWPVVAGPVVATASVPVGLRGKRLSIGVTHPAIGQEIKLRHSQIVHALARELGDDIVTTVVSVHRRSLAIPGRHVKRRR
jgi:Dna[CI] antecedent DciA-like protein